MNIQKLYNVQCITNQCPTPSGSYIHKEVSMNTHVVPGGTYRTYFPLTQTSFLKILLLVLYLDSATLCRVSGFHDGEDSGRGLVGCDAVLSCGRISVCIHSEDRSFKVLRRNVNTQSHQSK